MKKRLLRLSKRILILTLCTTLLSGSVINRYKITANATSIAVGVGSYAAYEIVLYVGGLLAACCGLGAAYDNRDKIAELGKDFIDSMNLDEVSDWLFTKVTTTGQSYVYGTEALQEIQDMSFSVIQGGGNRPDNDDDNNDDDEQGDGEHMVDVLGLGELAVFGTVAFYDLFEQYAEPLIEGIRNGEENIITDAFDLGLYSFGQYDVDSSGNYILNITVHKSDSAGNIFDAYCRSYTLSGYYLPCIYLEPRSNGMVNVNYIATKVDKYGELFRLTLPFEYKSTSRVGDVQVGNLQEDSRLCNIYSANIPVFGSLDAALAYIKSGDYSDCLNKSKVYQIADWLQEHWLSALEQLNTGIRSLYDNMLIVGEAANQALLNQLDGLGYIENLEDLISGAQPLPLPEEIADPVYVPGDSPAPELGPGDLPWVTPTPVPDPTPGDGGSGDDGTVPDDEIRGDDSFGINTIFSILILLIMILLMLLMIFLSCLAFIIMIFRIPASTGFLPEEMVAGLDYLKTLMIPGFGMSVYAFFMALIYIILIFTVIGILRKNIDKIKFPRKGKW